MSYEKPLVQELGEAIELTRNNGGDCTDACGCPAPKPTEDAISMDEE
jgi:hypothetical protein